MLKTNWIIEYWDNKKKAVKCFSNKKGSWKRAPKRNIIVIYIQRLGVRPYGKSDKLYTQIMRGTDNYFFYKKNNIVFFGMWNDDGRPTVMNTWYPDGRIESKVVVERPKGIPDDIVKTGVWVEEPWARKLGLSYSPNSAHKPQFKRKIKGCCKELL